MVAGRITQGRRRPDGTELHELEPGDYALATSKTTLWICLPNGLHGAVDSRWNIVVNDDETITVGPKAPSDSYSILTRRGGQDDFYWHGYLTDGVWTEVE